MHRVVIHKVDIQWSNIIEVEGDSWLDFILKYIKYLYTARNDHGKKILNQQV